GLGMTGLGGYGVELDIYDNAVCGDTSGDHVGVDDLSLCDPSEGTPTSLAETDVSATVDLADAHWHAAEITLAQGAVSVSVDGAVVESGVALPGLQVGAPYYFGFAAGTGGLVPAGGGPGGYRQEVKDVVITFPTPRCL
ncbi:MAG: lectin-like domain-containing protein, partial [Polyangiaceae bacterium]